MTVPSDCSQVRRALRSAHAVAAGGQDRRALGLSTRLPAAFAPAVGLAFAPAVGLAFALAVGLAFALAVGLAFALAVGPAVGPDRNVAGGLGGGRPTVTRPVADIARGADATRDTSATGRRTPCQPAAVVTATTRMARTASHVVRSGRRRGYIRRRPSHADGMLSAPAAERPAGPGVDGQPITSPSHGRNLSDRNPDQQPTRRQADRLAGGAGDWRAAAGGGIGERRRLPARVGGVQRHARRDDLVDPVEHVIVERQARARQ